MKLLLDQNLSFKLVSALQVDFPATCHVRDLGLIGADDETIWRVAAEQQFAILSKDSDFLHRSLLRGHPPKVIQLRLGNCSSHTILQSLLRERLVLHEFLRNPDESLLVIE
jgi:predicted nuclease of predicted toxin-antitoxin system